MKLFHFFHEQGLGRKCSREEGATEKDRKITKKDRKIALLSSSKGANEKKDQKIAKKTEK